MTINFERLSSIIIGLGYMSAVANIGFSGGAVYADDGYWEPVPGWYWVWLGLSLATIVIGIIVLASCD